VNPLAVLNAAWALRWVILIAALFSLVGIQTYRLQGRTAERDRLVLENTERARRDAMRDVANAKNKERTDEETAAARRRAAVVRVHGEPTEGVVAGQGIKLAPSGDAATVCFDRGRLDQELAGFVERHAAGLDRVAAGAARRGDERFTAVARAGEDLASSYRGCRVYTLNRQ
jgi:hypothetical protein